MGEGGGGVGEAGQTEIQFYWNSVLFGFIRTQKAFASSTKSTEACRMSQTLINTTVPACSLSPSPSFCSRLVLQRSNFDAAIRYVPTVISLPPPPSPTFSCSPLHLSLSLSLSMSRSVCLFLSVCLCLTLSLFLCISLSVCLSLSLCVSVSPVSVSVSLSCLYIVYSHIFRLT